MPAKTHGRLGAADLAATTDTTIYSPGASRKATVNVSICNRGSVPAAVRLAHIDAATVASIAAEDYLEYDLVLNPNDAIERTGITLRPQHCIGARASVGNVSVVVHGVEEDV